MSGGQSAAARRQQRLQRLKSLAAPAPLNGIEFVEVVSDDQRTLRLSFVHPVDVALAIGSAHFRIEGGVRITGIRVSASPAIVGRDVTLQVDRAGDFSDYLLRLVDPVRPQQPPAGIDPVLSQVRLNFKVRCPTPFDCAEPPAAAAAAPPGPSIDYLAKDYASFRRLMLDRVAQLRPGPLTTHPADFSVALVELLAHIGDQLSHFQDAVASEAYLGTARRRSSLRRHARLLDHPAHEGNNSRVYVAVEVAPGGTIELPAGATLGTTFGPRPVASIDALQQAVSDPDFTAFQTLHAQTLRASHNRIELHTWGEDPCTLAAGSTQATLCRVAGLALAPGDVLVLEESHGVATGLAADADRRRRQAVRLTRVEAGRDPMAAVDATTGQPVGADILQVQWHPEDALRLPLRVSAVFERNGKPEVQQLAVARGNVVLADQGLTQPWQAMQPANAPASGAWRPRLPDIGIAFAEPYRHRRFIAAGGSAAAALRQSAEAALPSLRLVADDPASLGDQPQPGEPEWEPVQDLLDSDAFARRFVAEVEHDGTVQLRFGDGLHGLAPQPGERLLARWRIGKGQAGNVGPGAITRLFTDDIALAAAVLGVHNPLSAAGGRAPASGDEIKLYAPQTHRLPQRAVTADDHARMAERHPEVQRAAARLAWNGSGYTLVLLADRRGGRAHDDAFRQALLQHLEPYRLMGHDVVIAEPVFVPMQIEAEICVEPGCIAADVERALLRRFGSGSDDGAQRGFFHPDRFSFGTPLPLSDLVGAAMAVDGVTAVRVLAFQRYGRSAQGELDAGVMRAGALEVLRLDNDPSRPEYGSIRFKMLGGA